MSRNRFQLRLVPAAFLLLLAGLIPSAVWAQIDTGGVTGLATDSSGSIVPGAKITLTNQATNVVSQTVSTGSGTYSLTGIRPGTYTLRAVSPGFQTFVQTGLEIHIQHTLTADIACCTGPGHRTGYCDFSCSFATGGECSGRPDHHRRSFERPSSEWHATGPRCLNSLLERQQLRREAHR